MLSLYEPQFLLIHLEQEQLLLEVQIAVLNIQKQQEPLQ